MSTPGPDLLRLLMRLDEARELGLLRALDVEMARFVLEHLPRGPASWVLATALLSRLEGLGHACLDLRVLHDDAPTVLGWPSESDAWWRSAFEPWVDLPSTADAAREAWAGLQPVLAEARLDSGYPASPLVLDGERLYWRRYWVMERRIEDQVRQRARAWPDAEDVDRRQRAQAWLDRLFGASDASAGREPDAQRTACERALQAGLTLVTGGPGTGKTTTAARLLVLLQALHERPSPLRVGLAAPTGKAAARLRSALDQGLQALRQDPQVDAVLQRAGPVAAAGTLHALLGVQAGTRRFRHDAQRPLALDVLMVDEASMVHLELFDALLQALPKTARLILLGDSDQLASVEAGSVVGDLCAAPPSSPVAAQTVRLVRSHRFSGAVGQLARAVNAGDATAVQTLLAQAHDSSVRRVRLPPSTRSTAGDVSTVEIARLALATAPAGSTGQASVDPSSHARWLQRLSERPRRSEDFEPWALDLIRGFDACRVLCAVREGPRGVTGINQAIEREAGARGWLQLRGAWYEGRPVMVTRNDPGLSLFNGDTGLVLRAPSSGRDGAGLRAWFAVGDRLRSVAVARLPEVETAYAMTVHKSQGSEFDHVVLVLPDDDLPVVSRELLYTGITRARHRLTLVCGEDEVLASAIRRRTRRMGGLRL